MKEYLLNNNRVYLTAFLLAWAIMLVTDYVLGKKAEHLNAWSVLLHTFNIKTDIPPSKAMMKFGLLGAWVVIVIVNSLFGFIAIQLLRFTVRQFFIVVTLVSICNMSPAPVEAQELLSPYKGWQVGFSFGELPVRGSFKAGITAGYHFNDKLYLGVIYQVPDKINRNKTSFNAQATGLEGVQSSSENVGQRFLLQGRYTPVRYAPHISFGFVFNDNDTETMKFDDRERIVNGISHNGAITIVQKRKRAFRPSLGLGYQYAFKRNISVSAEWTGALFSKIPTPDIQVKSVNRFSEDEEHYLNNKITDKFTSSAFNMYHIFHIGISYTFNERK